MTDKPNPQNKLAIASKAKEMAVTDQGIALRSVDDAIQFCTWVVESGMLPREISSPKKAFAIMARGAELGLKPFTSWRYIYMTTNGRLALESKGALAVCQGSPVFEDYQEGTEGAGRETLAWAIAKRKGRAPIRKEFTYEQAERAGLADERERRTRDGKVYKSTWQAYLEDMLLSKARARALDIAFADVLGGMPIRGEAEDIDAAEAERNGGRGMPRRDPEKPAVRDNLLDDLGPAKPEDQAIINAQVEEIFADDNAPVYEGEVVVEEEPEPQEEAPPAPPEPWQCPGCGNEELSGHGPCTNCGLQEGEEPPPPRRAGSNVKKIKKSKGQSSLLDK